MVSPWDLAGLVCDGSIVQKDTMTDAIIDISAGISTSLKMHYLCHLSRRSTVLLTSFFRMYFIMTNTESVRNCL
jgi:hypothetical protein